LAQGDPNSVSLSPVFLKITPSNNPNIEYDLIFVSVSGGKAGLITVFPDQSGLTKENPLTVPINSPSPQFTVNA
jgi:hypothetical protein